MEIEQLRMILDAAAAAGDGAMKVVIMWFALQTLKHAIGVGVIVAAYKIAVKIVHTVSLAGFVERTTGLAVTCSTSATNRFRVWLSENWEKDAPVS